MPRPRRVLERDPRSARDAHPARTRGGAAGRQEELLRPAVPAAHRAARRPLLLCPGDAELPAPGEHRREPGPLLRDPDCFRRALRRLDEAAFARPRPRHRAPRLRAAVQRLDGQLAPAHLVPRPDDGGDQAVLPERARGGYGRGEGEARGVAAASRRRLVPARHRLPLRLLDRSRMLVRRLGDDHGRRPALRRGDDRRRDGRPRFRPGGRRARRRAHAAALAFFP